MAKVGEEDPRWIVSDRSDGRNVNAWHWTEKDVTEWVKSRLVELVENQSIVDTPMLKCKTADIANSDGEGTVFNRKGKVSFLLELNFAVKWEGETFDDDGNSTGSCKGKLTVPDLEHDTDTAKLQVDVSCDSGSDNEKFLRLMQTEGRAWLRSRAETLLKELKAGHGVQEKKAGVTENVSVKKTPEKKKDAGENTDFATKIEWRVPPKEIWNALTEEGRVSAYTRSKAIIQLTDGGTFSFLNGSISGTFTEIELHKKLGMKWRLQDWADGQFSEVTIAFEEVESGTTQMILKQTGVPVSEVERTQQGWSSNFWEPIKMLFGYGYTTK
jgi:activator of HSP90 ATPase|uniref:Activator of Hsp90 ATPase AHSA1-like N-terminal domain-containing protein n=1 Tax=Eutreptiella gymnastica TaxID=73025 RepID=A0A7S4D0G8_9EUGL|mmetsp:Transcript_78671/g.131880  ORF Transcript_78671/g.131880 Transcript_78671/m.131880 type:complete len:327 (+) Transcript_78671:54-1034(+)